MWNKKQILEALRASEGQKLTFELPKRTALDDPFLQKQLAILKRQAEQYMESPVPPLIYKDFNLYKTTGDRVTFQDKYYERRGRLLTFSILSWLTQEAVYVAELEDIIWALCAEPFWCIPAHFTDVDVQPLPFEEYATQLDLFACETAFALAETLQLNSELLAVQVKQQLILQLDKRVFEPFLDGNRFFRFEQMDNNWSAVCAGAIGGAAIATQQNPLVLCNILHRTLSGMEVFLDSFGEDGICIEGIDYWTYGFGFFTCFAELLSRRTGGKLNMFALPKVHAIAKSQQAFYLPGGNTIAFSDGSENSNYRLGLSAFLQEMYRDVQLPPKSLAADIDADPCHRFCLALREFTWFSASATHSDFGAVHTTYYPDVEWFVSSTPKLTLVAKAGNNDESHNHNDCGSFVLQIKDEIVLCDFGAGLYDEKYFSSERYGTFVNASRSHNVALIEGQQQCAGIQFAASSPVVVSGEEIDQFETNLEKCYAVKSLQKYTRCLVHDKRHNSLLLKDEFVFEAASGICEVFVSRNPFVIGEAGIVNLDGAVLKYNPELLAASILSEEYMDHHGKPQTAHMLHLASICKAKKIAVEIVVQAR